MKYFKRIRAGIDPGPFLDEIAALGDAWAMVTGRQDKIAVQREALAIPLRGLRRSQIHGRKRSDVHESRWTSASAQFPHARAFLEETAAALACDLSRGKIVCLPAGRRVYPHLDRGRYYRLRGRYHLVLKSASGLWLKAADEEMRLRAGALWWFDNDQMREAFNDGDRDRIHMIFDLPPHDRRAEAQAATAAAIARMADPQARAVA